MTNYDDEFEEKDIEEMSRDELYDYRETVEEKYNDLYDNEPDDYDSSHDEWEEEIGKIEELLADIESRINELE